MRRGIAYAGILDFLGAGLPSPERYRPWSEPGRGRWLSEKLLAQREKAAAGG